MACSGLRRLALLGSRLPRCGIASATMAQAGTMVFSYCQLCCSVVFVLTTLLTKKWCSVVTGLWVFRWRSSVCYVLSFALCGLLSMSHSDRPELFFFFS
jgi:hypothetical protein